jgi:flagellar biogenesis protein FliO
MDLGSASMDGITGFDFIGSGAKALATLCFVLAVMVLVLVAMKKMVFHRQAGKKEAMIRRISSIPLSAQERIDVVEVSGQKLVLGVAQGGISLLLRLHEEAGEKGEPDGPKDQTAL